MTANTYIAETPKALREALIHLQVLREKLN